MSTRTSANLSEIQEQKTTGIDQSFCTKRKITPMLNIYKLVENCFSFWKNSQYHSTIFLILRNAYRFLCPQISKGRNDINTSRDCVIITK